MTTLAYLYDGERLAPVETGAAKPLRWAAWSPDGSSCLLVGNGGTAVRFVPSPKTGGGQFEQVDTATRHNLRGVAFSPDGNQALFVGNQGAVFLYEGAEVRPLASPTGENLRRAAWHPGGELALIVGNSGTVLRYEHGSLVPVPGDRAHTLRAIAWRPDGRYALVGAYASRYAGYPRPHPLYKCDGGYLQALYGSDDEDDFVAVDWRANGQQALVVGYAYDGERAVASNKLLTSMAGASTSVQLRRPERCSAGPGIRVVSTRSSVVRSARSCGSGMVA